MKLVISARIGQLSGKPSNSGQKDAKTSNQKSYQSDKSRARSKVNAFILFDTLERLSVKIKHNAARVENFCTAQLTNQIQEL